MLVLPALTFPFFLGSGRVVCGFLAGTANPGWWQPQGPAWHCCATPLRLRRLWFEHFFSQKISCLRTCPCSFMSRPTRWCISRRHGFSTTG